MSEKFFVSLGVDCRVKYQISRFSAYSRNPGITKSEFESALYGSSRNVTGQGTYFFDWLVTPIGALRHCMKNDFEGVFEKDDLCINENATGVKSRSLNITFQHNFSRVDGKIPADAIFLEYDAQRAKIDYLRNKTLDLFRSDMSCNYIRVGGSDNDIFEIENALTTMNPEKEFRIFSVDLVDGEGGQFSRISEKSIRYDMSRANSKPPIAQWQGDDQQWAQFFDRIKDQAV